MGGGAKLTSGFRLVSSRQVKPSLREPHLELLSLPVGDYVVRVRCRSKNSLLWSKWSATMLMSIPARPSAGRGCYGNSSSGSQMGLSAQIC